MVICKAFGHKGSSFNRLQPTDLLPHCKCEKSVPCSDCDVLRSVHRVAHWGVVNPPRHRHLPEKLARSRIQAIEATYAAVAAFLPIVALLATLAPATRQRRESAAATSDDHGRVGRPRGRARQDVQCAALLVAWRDPRGRPARRLAAVGLRRAGPAKGPGRRITAVR